MARAFAQHPAGQAGGTRQRLGRQRRLRGHRRVGRVLRPAGLGAGQLEQRGAQQPGHLGAAERAAPDRHARLAQALHQTVRAEAVDHHHLARDLLALQGQQALDPVRMQRVDLQRQQVMIAPGQRQRRLRRPVQQPVLARQRAELRGQHRRQGAPAAAHHQRPRTRRRLAARPGRQARGGRLGRGRRRLPVHQQLLQRRLGQRRQRADRMALLDQRPDHAQPAHIGRGIQPVARHRLRRRDDAVAPLPHPQGRHRDAGHAGHRRSAEARHRVIAPGHRFAVKEGCVHVDHLSGLDRFHRLSPICPRLDPHDLDRQTQEFR